ncbi:lethal(3)malignant brain tumor-like protein 4 isoform X3 [Heterodontus francisci]|uniref:lethal(3)malignant brain tumor-like protein 4 isoform X3 n=1 Tax=Heterodontus francisci TaxID=7792 RepID=UPI00355C586F
MELGTREENVNAPPGQDFDLLSAMEWKDGIATLPGSNLKFRMTEFNTLEIITNAETENGKDTSLKNGSRAPDSKASQNPEEVPSMDGIYCCENCGHYGTIEHFSHGGKFCTEACAQQYKESTCKPTHIDVTNGNGTIMKRLRKKRKLLLDWEDEDLQMGEDEEALEEFKVKTKIAQESHLRGRRGPKLLKQALAVPGKKKTWNWASYLEEEKMQAAPLKLFKEYQLFPQSRNGFKLGMRLEGIDPEHPSIFCVLSVAEVQGYRIRLHFDGYSECYDFWVNADSPDIHPFGWCEKTGHKLHLPKGYKDSISYLKSCKAQAAPKNLFRSLNTPITPSGFRVGMKLEAVDKKNPSLTCVATIADMVDNRLLIHFDNWDDSYDYWCDASSPYIRPVGSCQTSGLPLTTPPEYKDTKDFSWEKYLEDSGAQAAPARAFKQRPPHGFHLNMKLEAVDKRNPMLIRVATVVDLEDHRIKIHFDGWSHDYDYWIDADSPDIHPAGWSAKTGHSLQIPLSPADLAVSPGPGGCPTPGCKGIGHIKGARYAAHYTLVSCPYSEINLNKEMVLPDRLSGERQSPVSAAQKLKKMGTQAISTAPESEDASMLNRKTLSQNGAGNRIETHYLTGQPAVENGQEKGVGKECCEELPAKKPQVSVDGKIKQRKVGRPPKYLKLQFVKQEEEETLSRLKETAVASQRSRLLTQARSFIYLSLNNEMDKTNQEKDVESDYNLQQALHQSVFMSSVSPHPTQRLYLCWEQHSKLLPEVAGHTAKKVAKWSIEEQIDGEAFLLLNQTDIVKIMSIKLGPALKIYNSILMFKNAEENGSEVS